MNADDEIDWMIVAPLPAAELEAIAHAHWTRQKPFAIGDPPWEVKAGPDGCSALISRLPGSVGTDRPIAEAASRAATTAEVYALWFAPGLHAIHTYRDGHRTNSRDDAPGAFAASLGFPVPAQHPSADPLSVALVEGATLEQIREALGETAAKPWLRLEALPNGVLMWAADGSIGMAPWEAAPRLPGATVFIVLANPGSGEFQVLVKKGATSAGMFAEPAIGDDLRPDIKGETKPRGILRVLGIHPGLLGLS